MCGITVCVRPTSHDPNAQYHLSTGWTELLKQNAARGPDSQRREDVTVPGFSLSFIASTLHLRGATLVPQPHLSDKSIFCWNGEVFEGLDISPQNNDGKVLFAALETAKTPEDIRFIMSNIEGPYALVLFQRSADKLFFARDPLGRRSLLVRYPDVSNPCLIISSATPGSRTRLDYEEVNPKYIHCIDLSHLRNSGSDNWYTNRCSTSLERTNPEKPALFGKLAQVNAALPENLQLISASGPLPDELELEVQRFTEIMDRSVRLRVQNIPRSDPNNKSARIAVLYSGGIDSTIIAFLASRHIPLDEPIDLLNVAFENPRKLRIHSADNRPKRRHKHNKIPHAEVLNNSDTYNVPDRKTGLEQLEELRQLCPGRHWNFVEVDVDYTESSAAREMVENVMFPSRTVMDFSLALALYFASRGIGNVRETASGTSKPYTSTARVLLSGLGSDELLGGYGRHRSAFNTGGWKALVEELQLELDRLPSRNLGRDDRIISSHGKETRHPFLSLGLVNFIASLPVHLKLDPRLELGLGDKMLLRLAARKLGLELASRRKKKAMQFGSHSARMEGGDADKDGERILRPGFPPASVVYV